MEIQGNDKRTSELVQSGGPAAPPPGTPTASDERAAATARFQAFAEGRPPPQSDPAWTDKTACGGFVENTVLNHQEVGEAHDVSGNDVAQQGISDCALMATLSILTSSPEGRAFIHSAVVENKDDQGRTTSYLVTLYRPAWTLFGEPRTYSPVRIEVDPAMCRNYAKPRGEDGTYEVWSQAIEKAFCIYKGGKKDTNVPGNEAMEILTGIPATKSSITGFLFGGYSGQQLVSDLRAGKMIVLGSKEGLSGSWVANHAYAVVGVETYNGELCAVLHNPWNLPKWEPAPVPLNQLGRYFDHASVGSLR